MDVKHKIRLERRAFFGPVDLADPTSMGRLQPRLNNSLLRCLYFEDVHNFDWLRELNPIRCTRCLMFNDCSVTTSDFTNLVATFPMIDDLRMVNTTPEVDSVSVEQIAKWTTLRHVTLLSRAASGNGIHHTEANRLINIIANQCHCLNSVYINYRGINDSSFTSFFGRHGPYIKRLLLPADYLTELSYNSLALCAMLTTLDIDQATNMTNDNLLNIMHNMQRLKLLRLREGRLLFSDNFVSLFKTKKFPRLCQLIIFRCDQLNDETLYIVVKCCPRLEKFNLEYLTAISDQGLLQIVQFCGCLKLLSVGKCPRISADHIEQIRSKFKELGMQCPAEIN